MGWEWSLQFQNRTNIYFFFKLKWFTFFFAIFILVVGQKGAIFSHILRYKKGKLETNKTGYVVL